MLTYDEWLMAIFDHQVEKWFFTDDENPELWELLEHPATAVEYITRMFEESGKLPERFSDQQIADGIKYIIEPSCSNFPFAIVDPNMQVSSQARTASIEAIHVVYEQLFSKRCSSQIAASTQDKDNRNPLNYVCFMWWDIFPTHGHPDQDEYAEIDTAILAVIERTLEIDSEACQEAALHGLSEWHFRYPRKVKTIAQRWLAENLHISPELRSYAERASWGGVQ